MRFTSTVAASAVAAVASAQNYLGFNSGATLADRSAKFKADFKAEFETAAKLNNSPGKFNSVRLYTNIQAYSEEEPIEAFDAAVETKTNVLLGVWASGTDNIDKEIRALKKAIEKHGDDLTDLIIGVTIGSEDLYRVSETGIKNESGVGNSPKAITDFIKDWRDAFGKGALAGVPVGHADTWDAWGNSTNKAVIDAVDFVAVHEYPYYENDKGNHIDNAGALFDRAYQAVAAAAGDKPIWVTETGWPYVGPDWDEAEASIKNAKKYWQDVGCRRLFNKVPTFWYTLRDSNPDNEMKFAITDDLNTKPYFDLSCPDHFDTPSTTSKASDHKTSTTASSSTKTDESDDESTSTFTTVTTASPSTTPSSDDNEEEGNSEESTDDNSEENDSSNNDNTSDNTNDDNTSPSNDNTSDDSSNESTPTGDSSSPTETPGAPGAASSLKMLSVASYVVLGLAGAAFTLL